MPKLAELSGDENSGESSRTFVFEDEGHTLGNVLKSIICKYPDVNFCGYTVPHPAENKMHFRIQAAKSVRAIDILRRGLEDLERVCDHTIETFEAAIALHQQGAA
ncbi:probable DNA-directed RNA polymerases I and III subunit RPAC2 [Anopheles maculipalpis]|uniref:DNA-directed RNA polymerases I and III subunit RPAC2 n=1 Tax=Anopheles stephensi TaxID=30069 RepID=A0A182Y8B7_ANOST|nr:probable DNA-directed RNA polymerases I and III subunit RPAC2 [Anopheles stephensi]XP_050078835.1 probable DNA-directed RNA polymerases I and III subunit RPAC2 [Anopheles maculipalpis]